MQEINYAKPYMANNNSVALIIYFMQNIKKKESVKVKMCKLVYLLGLAVKNLVEQLVYYWLFQ